jgi:hypothetical protein
LMPSQNPPLEHLAVAQYLCLVGYSVMVSGSSVFYSIRLS